MKRTFATIFSILYLTFLNAQINLSYKISDCKTHEPVPYAHIGIVDKTFGTVSDEKGLFTLNVPLKFVEDTLTISFVGYETKKIAIKNIHADIELCPSNIQLKEVVVVPKKEKILGRTSEGGNSMTAFQQNKSGLEIAKLIKNNRKVYVNKIGIYAKDNTYDSMTINVTFYKANGHKIGNIINTKSLLWKVDKKTQGWLYYELPAALIVEGDFFIGLEIVKSSSPKDFISFWGNYNFGKKTTYKRFASQDSWKPEEVNISMVAFVNVD